VFSTGVKHELNADGVEHRWRPVFNTGAVLNTISTPLTPVCQLLDMHLEAGNSTCCRARPESLHHHICGLADPLGGICRPK
jgi:hypothetical protein